MIEVEQKSKCCGCYGCYNICPKNAIEMVQDEKGFYYPKVIKEKCINCGLCNQICPISNKTEIINSPKAFAAYNKEEKIRKESSSGGVFTLLAEKILEQNGVVFGAKFDKNFNVIHSYVEKIEDLEVFRGSKYVQSKIGETYKKAEEFLKNGRLVLFSGTPCQIEGLKKYIRKEYDNLYTQDIICHGVPSEKVHQKYLKHLEKKIKTEIKEVRHRTKINGWKKWTVNITFKNKQNYQQEHDNDIYMKAFLRNISLRDSCYECSFKKKNRISDITLADFWGIENILPEMDDDKGTSLVIINSEKGQELFDNVKNNLIVKEVDFEKAISYNPSLIKSEEPDKNRDKFFRDLDKLDFDKLVKKYIPKRSLLRRTLSKCKRILKAVCGVK